MMPRLRLTGMKLTAYTPDVTQALGFAALSPAYGWHWRVSYAELEIGTSAQAGLSAAKPSAAGSQSTDFPAGNR